VGKTAYAIALALAIITGRRDNIDQHVFQPGKVWLLTPEDDREELERRVAAAMIVHKIVSDKVAGRLFGVDLELSTVATGGAAATSGSQLESLTASSHKTVSELQYLIAYSDLQNAYGRILNSVGANRLPLEIEHQSVVSLKADIRKLIDNWKIDLPTARFASK